MIPVVSNGLTIYRSSTVSHFPAQEAEGPFPWASLLGPPTDHRSADDLLKRHAETIPLPKWVTSLPSTLQSNPSLLTIASEAAAMSEFLAFDLPPPNAVAGKVLQHSISVIERTFEKWYPMIFKIGYTHNPCWRWSNPLYGYGHVREKWSNMIVLYVCEQPYGPAMLEAALIEKYSSPLAKESSGPMRPKHFTSSCLPNIISVSRFLCTFVLVYMCTC